MSIKISLKEKEDKTDELIEALRKGSVKVGWSEKNKYNNDMYVAEVAFLNENGHDIKRNGKMIGHVPPRPFLALTMTNNDRRWQFIWKKLYKQVLDKKISFESALDKFGEIVRQSIKDMIVSSVPPPNAPSTIRHKQGRQITLIDTGEMLKTVNVISVEAE